MNKHLLCLFFSNYYIGGKWYLSEVFIYISHIMSEPFVLPFLGTINIFCPIDLLIFFSLYFLY